MKFRLLSPRFFLSTSLVASAALLGGCQNKSSSPSEDCVPQTCESLGANCGLTTDGCGTILDCGPVDCSAGQTCGALARNQCGVGNCAPVSCVSELVDCGPLGNGCGAIIDCGSECDGFAHDPPGPNDGGGSGGSGNPDPGSGGSPNPDPEPPPPVKPLGEGVFQGSGVNTNSPTPRYAEGYTRRDHQEYMFMVNGWGDGYQSSTVSWNGTSFKVTMSGTPDPYNGVPIGFPTVFCGNYSNKVGRTNCGLPAAIATSTSMDTAWRWAKNGTSNQDQYNAAYDIWLGDGTNLQSYLMVWLRDPPDEQPAGSYRKTVSNVAGLTGSWDIWAGNVTVNGRTHPIINYVRAEGSDVLEVRFDVLDLIADARAQNVGQLPGTHVNGVAVGFEVWDKVTNAESVDFYVDPR